LSLHDTLPGVGDEGHELTGERRADLVGADSAEKVSHRDGISSRVTRAFARIGSESSLPTWVRRFEKGVGGEDPGGGRYDDSLRAEEVFSLVGRQIGGHVIRPCQLLNQHVDVIG
jgi:hypothetical protein